MYICEARGCSFIIFLVRSPSDYFAICSRVSLRIVFFFIIIFINGNNFEIYFLVYIFVLLLNYHKIKDLPLKNIYYSIQNKKYLIGFISVFVCVCEILVLIISIIYIHVCVVKYDGKKTGSFFRNSNLIW